MDGVRTLIPPGFMRLVPKLAANQTLAELANLLGAQSGPTSRDDAVAVERNIIHILRLMGPMAALRHLKSSSKDHSLLSPLELLEATYMDWKAYLETFEQPRLLPLEEGWLAKFDSSPVNLSRDVDRAARGLCHQAILQCETWINMLRRGNSQLIGAEAQQRQKNSKGWKLLQWAADLVRPSVNSHTVFALPALQG